MGLGSRFNNPKPIIEDLYLNFHGSFEILE
jgi:hypothetical protein